MRIFLLVQDEPFHLHRHLRLLLDRHEVVGASVLSQRLPSDSIVKLVRRYLDLFGPRAFMKLGAMTAWRTITGRGSLRRLLRENHVPLVATVSVNAPAFIEHVANLAPEVIVSVACPQIIRGKLLAAAPRGGVNLHGGYLPDFPGVAFIKYHPA